MVCVCTVYLMVENNNTAINSLLFGGFFLLGVGLEKLLLLLGDSVFATASGLLDLVSPGLGLIATNENKSLNIALLRRMLQWIGQ